MPREGELPNGIAAGGSAFYASGRGHRSFALAHRNGVAVTAAFTAMGLILAFVDRQSRHSRQRDRPRTALTEPARSGLASLAAPKGIRQWTRTHS